ncbi:hypothetical protein MOQ_007094 [Trypanosoma cruzi marinkellei]|uniref:Uncharacterized protein n=1 Tax=Trypanosoma cruzi marinkellei TaxID=85056 RepID=K2N3G2_TRYCR|nr:hypothetical protein MOQ_007094 [Trypanosoma cruzi marinkellei]
MPSSEVYCAEEANGHRLEGTEVPTRNNPCLSVQGRCEAGESRGSAQTEDGCVIFPEEIKNGTENVVAAVLKCTSLQKSHHGFHRFKAESERRAVLSSLELLLRLYFLDCENKALLTAIRGLRKQVVDLRNQDVFGCARGKYPEVYILYEFFSLRKLLLNWGKLGADNQIAAMETALKLVVLVKSLAYVELEAHLRAAKEKPQLVEKSVTNIVACLDQACCDTPYGFFSICCNVIPAVHPHYTGPVGKLAPEFAFKEEGSETDDDIITSPEDESVGCVIGLARPLSKKRMMDRPEPRQFQGACLRHTAKAKKENNVCCSKYHTQYSTAERHASKECQFCVVCHMMEILFNGYTKKCCWGHGPSENRIAFHLKRYPRVYEAALQRLAKWRQGVSLPPCESIF